jgi:glycosyltransferase involved in cell wall biosynthesis
VLVGLNLLFLVPGVTGGRETYAREVAVALAERHPRLRFVSLVGRDAAEDRDGWWRQVGRVVTLPLSARSRPQWAWGELAAVPAAAARARVAVLHSMGNFGPWGGPFARVLTLHDLQFRRVPELLPAPLRLGTELLLPPAAQLAHAVITGSEASRQDIVRELRVRPERVHTIPYAVRPPDRRRRAPAPLPLPDDRPVLLSVASDLPHKNLGTLLRALALLEPAERPRLAVAGSGTDRGGLPALARELGVERDVRLLGVVDDATLEALYAAAHGLVTATRFEGFGLPVLEAMLRDVPVACSDLPVLREVAGDAAIFHDPGDPASVARSLRALTADPDLAARLRAGGRRRAAAFSWARAADATAAVYGQVVSARAARPPRTRGW